jgi:hypothetical protein
VAKVGQACRFLKGGDPASKLRRVVAADSVRFSKHPATSNAAFRISAAAEGAVVGLNSKGVVNVAVAGVPWVAEVVEDVALAAAVVEEAADAVIAKNGR